MNTEFSLRVGNFLLKNERDANDVYRIEASALSGQFQVSWGDGSMMYGLLLKMMQDGDKEKLSALLYLLFGTVSYAHSTEFYLGLNRMISKEIAEIREQKEAVSKEEDEKALKEAVQMEEVKEALNEEMENGDA